MNQRRGSCGSREAIREFRMGGGGVGVVGVGCGVARLWPDSGFFLANILIYRFVSLNLLGFSRSELRRKTRL